MAKLTILVATLTAFLLLVDASIYRTTVIIDDRNPRMSEDCREEMMRQQNLKHCQQHIMQETRRRGRYVNPREEEHFDMCCEQLREISKSCRCDALEMAIEQMEPRMIEREDVPMAKSITKDLPNKCGVEPRECRFSSRYEMW